MNTNQIIELLKEQMNVEAYSLLLHSVFREFNIQTSRLNIGFFECEEAPDFEHKLKEYSFIPQKQERLKLATERQNKLIKTQMRKLSKQHRSILQNKHLNIFEVMKIQHELDWTSFFRHFEFCAREIGLALDDAKQLVFSGMTLKVMSNFRFAFKDGLWSMDAKGRPSFVEQAVNIQLPVSMVQNETQLVRLSFLQPELHTYDTFWQWRKGAWHCDSKIMIRKK
jgi:hypothetical protein